MYNDHDLDRMPVSQKDAGCRSFYSVWWLSCALLLVAAPVLAADGVVEINQACVTGGCFTGDSPGFPVTITKPGAYRLTSDLVVPASKLAIQIRTGDVGIDLHGFAILGASCAVVGGVCNRTTGVLGIEASFTGFSLPGVSVRNGTVAGMQSNALRLGPHAVVLNVIVSHTGGISVGVGSVVRRSVFESNNIMGVQAGSIVSENVVRHSTDPGPGRALTVSEASVITRNTFSENETAAMESTAFGGSVILTNSIYRNAGAGIRGGGVDGAIRNVTIANNTVYENGTDAGADVRDGIRVLGSLVVGNTIHGNAGAGLTGSDSGYRENVISDNGGGTVTGAGMVNLNGNLCNGVASCP